MEITRRKKRTEKIIIRHDNEPCHDLQLYLLNPQSVLALAEFEELALDRLKALRIVEQTLIRDTSKSFEERRATIQAELKKQNLKLYSKLLASSGCKETEADLKARVDDHNAHFILRIAYCRSDALRKWLLAREVEFFQLRFLSLSSKGVRNFLDSYHIKYTPITDDEKSSIKDMLVTSTQKGSHATIESIDFYKVPFQEVSDLVAHRKVFLSGGFAYVPNTELVYVVSYMFRNILDYGLHRMACHLSNLEEDERVNDFVSGLHTMHTGDNYSTTKEPGSIKPEDLDPLSRVSFPLCMRQIHESIRANHHAKHGSRMQYGLYLKAIGLSLEDSLRFWRESFSKKIDVDSFDKKYAYNIRHNYGQEGRRVSYTPFSCMKIIQGSVGAGDCHGCPFRHNDANILRQRLQNYGVPAHGLQDIMDLVQQHHYQIACTKYFELSHNAIAPEVVNHPNQFFEMSQEILTGKTSKKIKKEEKPASTAVGSTNVNSNGSAVDAQEKVNTSVMEQDQWDSMDVDMSALMEGIDNV